MIEVGRVAVRPLGKSKLFVQCFICILNCLFGVSECAVSGFHDIFLRSIDATGVCGDALFRRLAKTLGVIIILHTIIVLDNMSKASDRVERPESCIRTIRVLPIHKAGN